MVAATVYPHIVKAAGEPARLESHPRTRVAQIVMECVGHGSSPDEIQRQHPYLTLAEIHSRRRIKLGLRHDAASDFLTPYS